MRATRARCRVVGGMVPATSQNVVIDLPGTDLADDILYASAHHDTQANSPGADDNGSGVVGVLELARLLQPLPRRRTIRLISFGAEEQLSVGSAAYVRAHRDEVSRRGRCMYNLDSYGSHLGWLQLYINGHADFEAVAASVLPRRGYLLPDDHRRRALRRSLPVRGGRHAWCLPLSRQLRWRTLLPPSP